MARRVNRQVMHAYGPGSTSLKDQSYLQPSIVHKGIHKTKGFANKALVVSRSAVTFTHTVKICERWRSCSLFHVPSCPCSPDHKSPRRALSRGFSDASILRTTCPAMCRCRQRRICHRQFWIRSFATLPGRPFNIPIYPYRTL